MSSSSQVVQAIRTLLTDSGYNVVLFRQVDEDNDTLPAVSVRFGQNGERPIGDTRPPRKIAEFDILWVGETDDGHEIEALEQAEAIEEILVPFNQDVPTKIGGAVVKHKQTNVETRETHTDTIASLVTISAEWVNT